MPGSCKVGAAQYPAEELARSNVAEDQSWTVVGFVIACADRGCGTGPWVSWRSGLRVRLSGWAGALGASGLIIVAAFVLTLVAGTVA
jgi:hypothetical protein